jgi:hypothetical protein
MSLENIASYEQTTPVKPPASYQVAANFFKFKSDMKKRNIFKFFTSGNGNHKKAQKPRIPIGNGHVDHQGRALKSSDYLLIEFCIKRSSTTADFGFTVVGYCPCQIGRVDTNSVAYKAGLQYGDQIIRVDSENVSRATSDRIVKLIR